MRIQIQVQRSFITMQIQMKIHPHRFILPTQTRFLNRSLSPFSSPSLFLSNNAQFRCRSTTSPLSLLGPPELYNPIGKLTGAGDSSGIPFIDVMVANFNKLNDPPMGYTENMSPTYLSSGNPCLDFFFHIVPDTDSEFLKKRLESAWDYNSLTTLKLICNLRGVRGTGKSDREGFYTAAFWLHQNHPKTLAFNVPSIAQFGYFKDLLEILYRLLEGLDVRLKQKNQRFYKSSRGSDEMIRAEKNKKRLSMAKKALECYRSDPDYRFLYDTVSEFFADCLKADIQYLKSDDLTKISLAAKWCPSIDSSFDRSTLLCEGIARRVFPRESYPEYEGIEEAHYAYRVRDRLRKEILVPLRKALELPEVYIGANRWDSIPYNRVASVAMTMYQDKFLKHDRERFVQYLEDVRTGKTKITAGALLPHEIISCLHDDDGLVAELQWKRMVDDLLKIGKLRNCIAVCDVSGSMSGIPMEVCVALGLLVSELSEDPWKGKVITFSQRPQLHLIKGDDLKSKSEFVREMEWGMNTDFQKVFDLILRVAVDGKLKEEEMIKRVFVFSDMEFDQASNNSWETDYKVIVRKFTEKGYGSVVPQIVFWNLRDSMATPVLATEDGVAMVSGFSKNLIKLFLNNDGTINPELVMEMALSGKEYQKLVVVD